MKGTLFGISVYFATALGLSAQITITNAAFPQPGDTLLTAIDNLPSNIPITPSARESQTWDFTSLQAPFSRQMVIRSASVGAASSSFPDANMLAGLAENTEGYLKGSESSIELIGLFGMDPLALGLNIETRYNPPVIERRAPMNFFDINQTTSTLSLPFSADDIPSNILDNLPITPDSLRIRITLNRLDSIEAWGILTIPGGIYDVLREKRTEIRDTRLDAKIGFLPWQDITDIVSELLPMADLLGKDTTVTYNYFSNEAKEPIAVLRVDNTETSVQSVEFKANDPTSSVQSISSLKPGVYAFPNPAIVNVRFEFSNLRPGKYDLKIYNILGMEVWRQQYYVNGNHTEKVDISSLKKGTYLYSLIDRNGKTITTRRLVVVRP